jgi:alanyl-tRNA synthetase
VTKRLYYDDPALLEFEAVVTGLERHARGWLVSLDRTAFYPTSGGQPNDLGWIQDTAVIDVIESDSGDILHLTEQSIGALGDLVKGRVEARRRQRHRQSHTAQHILSAAFARLANLRTESIHLREEYPNIEFPTKSNQPEVMAEVETLANDVIAQGIPVEILAVDAAEAARLPLRKEPQREGLLRIIKIGDFECSACGGTHCSNTAEVGLIKIVGTERIRSRVAVVFLAGQLALQDYRLRFEATDALSKTLTCHPKDLPERFLRLSEENKTLRKELTQLQRQQLPHLVAGLVERATEAGAVPITVASVDDVSSELLTALATDVVARTGGVTMLCHTGRLVVAAAEQSKRSAGALVKALAAETGLRGGGNDRLAQIGGADPARLDRYAEILRRLIADA